MQEPPTAAELALANSHHHDHPHQPEPVPAPPKPAHFDIWFKYPRNSPFADRHVDRAGGYGFDSGVFHWLEATGEIHFVRTSDYAEIIVLPRHE